MHILFTANAAWNIQNFRRPIVEAMLSEGHHVTVLAPHDDTVVNLEKMGCQFISLPMDVKGLSPRQDFTLVQNFKKIFKTEQPDIIFSYTIKNNIFGAIAARGLGIPFVPNVTGLGTAFLSGGVLQFIAQSLYRHAFSHLRIVFFQNSDDRNLFVGNKLLKERQTRLLPGSGVDLGSFTEKPLPSVQGAPVFLLIARLIKDKGIHEYVRAARNVHSKHPHARFQILGAIGAENRGAINTEIVTAWETEGVIEYLGETEDVRPFIKNADCVVLPSYREGAPRTLMEAAAMARPIITTDVPGCRSIVNDGETGYLCTVKDDKSLALACLQFIELAPLYRKKMGLAGRSKMKLEFDHNIIIKAYTDALNDCMNR